MSKEVLAYIALSLAACVVISLIFFFAEKHGRKNWERCALEADEDNSDESKRLEEERLAREEADRRRREEEERRFRLLELMIARSAFPATCKSEDTEETKTENVSDLKEIFAIYSDNLRKAYEENDLRRDEQYKRSEEIVAKLSEIINKLYGEKYDLFSSIIDEIEGNENEETADNADDNAACAVDGAADDVNVEELYEEYEETLKKLFDAESKLEECEKTLADNEKTLADLESEIQNKDNELKENLENAEKSLIAQNEELAEKDALIAEKDAEIAEKDALLAEKAEADSANEESALANEEKLRELNGIISEYSESLTEKEAALNAQAEELAAKDEVISQKDAIIEEQEKLIKELNALIDMSLNEVSAAIDEEPTEEVAEEVTEEVVEEESTEEVAGEEIGNDECFNEIENIVASVSDFDETKEPTEETTEEVAAEVTEEVAEEENGDDENNADEDEEEENEDELDNAIELSNDGDGDDDENGDDDNGGMLLVGDGDGSDRKKVIPLNFRMRLKVASDKNKDYYVEIKNLFNSKRKLMFRISGRFEKVNYHGETIAMIGVAKRAIRLWLALDTADFDEGRYHWRDYSEKPLYMKVPLMIRVGSDRAMRRASELIDALVEKYQLIEKRKYQDQDLQELALTLKHNKLLKNPDLKPLLTDSIHIVDTSVLTREQATDCIESKPISFLGEENFATVKLGVIEENFVDGQKVTLDALKRKGLVSEECNGYRVSTGERLTKPLIVVANGFTVGAIKLIVLTGGRVIRLEQPSRPFTTTFL